MQSKKVTCKWKKIRILYCTTRQKKQKKEKHYLCEFYRLKKMKIVKKPKTTNCECDLICKTYSLSEKSV